MARWRISLLVAGIVLAIGALIGISLRGSPDSSSPEPARIAEPPAIRSIEKGDEYVAMGDSYTAAPGTGPSTDDCLQTTTNYPHKVAAKLGLKLTDVSCGGATTAHVTTSQTIGSTQRPPQADAVSRDTDLVTISFGGNDAQAVAIVTYGCVAIRARDPFGAPCQEVDAARGRNTVASTIKATEQSLVDVITLVAKRAPTARIVVVGYPEFLPEAGPCAQLPLALGDYAFAHRINDLLVRAQKHAAARTNVDYVDVFTASRGHDMCAKDPWIAGLSPTRTDATPLHPYPEEQQLVANLLVDLLTRAATPNREQPAGR